MSTESRETQCGGRVSERASESQSPPHTVAESVRVPTDDARAGKLRSQLEAALVSLNSRDDEGLKLSIAEVVRMAFGRDSSASRETLALRIAALHVAEEGVA